MSYININNQRIVGGLFENIDDAINSRLQLENQYFTYLSNIQDNYNTK